MLINFLSINLHLGTSIALVVILAALGVLLAAMVLSWLWKPSKASKMTHLQAQKEEVESQKSAYDTHIQEGNRLYEEYRYQDALTHYLEAIKLNNKDATVYYRLGRIYKTLNDYPHAESAFQHALNIHPNNEDILYELSHVYSKQAKTDMALMIADRLLAQSPNNEDGKKLKIRLLIDKKDLYTAADMLRDILAQEPENTEMQLLMAKTLQELQRWNEALPIYQKLLPKDPEDRKNLKYQIYYIYASQALYNNAIETLEDILASGTGTVSEKELKTELAKCWCNKAREHARLNEEDDAHKCYQNALECDPDYGDIYSGLGQLIAEQGDKERAIEYYQKTIALNSANPKVYLDLALLYEQLDRFDDAIACMEEAEQQFQTAEIYYYLGTLYGLKGNLDKCIDNLNYALDKDPELVDAYYNLGVAYEHQQKHREALNMYKKTLELNKDHTEAKTNYKYLQTRMTKW